MIAVHAPRLDIDECRTPEEAEFIAALHAKAEAANWYGLAWLREDRIIVTVDLCDNVRSLVVRTLRVDYGGAQVLAGIDETGQLATDLTPLSPGVVVHHGPPSELAHKAALWLEREMERPIERQEWDCGHVRWVCGETGEVLVGNASRGAVGPPDSVETL